MYANTIWELAHEDGSSIFIQQADKTPFKTLGTITFGPFLFPSEDMIEFLKDAGGPRSLLESIPGRTYKSQPISLGWVLEHSLTQFDPVQSDAVVVGDFLLPLSHKGAILADSFAWQHDKRRDAPWQQLAGRYGEDTLRIISANIVRGLCDFARTPGPLQ